MKARLRGEFPITQEGDAEKGTLSSGGHANSEPMFASSHTASLQACNLAFFAGPTVFFLFRGAASPKWYCMWAVNRRHLNMSTMLHSLKCASDTIAWECKRQTKARMWDPLRRLARVSRFWLLALVAGVMITGLGCETPESLAEKGDVSGLLKRYREAQEPGERNAVRALLVRFPDSDEAAVILRQEQARDPEFAASLVQAVASSEAFARRVLDWVGTEPFPDRRLTEAVERTRPELVDNRVTNLLATVSSREGFETASKLLQLLTVYGPLFTRESNAARAAERLSVLLPRMGSPVELTSGARELCNLARAALFGAPQTLSSAVKDVMQAWATQVLERMASGCESTDGLVNVLSWLGAVTGFVHNEGAWVATCLELLDIRKVAKDFHFSRTQLDNFALALPQVKESPKSAPNGAMLLSFHVRYVLERSVEDLSFFTARKDLVAFLVSSNQARNLADPTAKQLMKGKIQECDRKALGGLEKSSEVLRPIVDFAEKVFQADTRTVKAALDRLAGAKAELEAAEQQVSKITGDLAEAKEALQKAKEEAARFRRLEGFIVAALGASKYEVSLPVYTYWFGPLPSRRRALLFTNYTQFLSTGWFSLWVEKGPDEPVMTVSGFIEVWPTFVEATRLEVEAARMAVEEARKRVREIERALQVAEREATTLPRTICRQVNTALSAYAQAVRTARTIASGQKNVR